MRITPQFEESMLTDAAFSEVSTWTA